jgi:hypothetical protein
MIIEEKALQLAEYDGYIYFGDGRFISKEGYERLTSLKFQFWRWWWKIKIFYTKGDIEYENKEKEKIINQYSSFDKLMELFVEVNLADNDYIININEFGVRLDKFNDIIGSKNIGFCMNNKNNYSLKEALMDCLLKYYELTKGK